ncbi:MAG TPA: spore gernimation protein [Micromonosporaceae bacterium]|nr:spore gernimation protein [Micromonosporaceae bacterium]HCU49482.1 spore gernimation protein [Micromonosporaceae bacterium]
MKRLIALLSGTVLVALSACGPGESGSLGPAPTGVPPSTAPATQSPTPVTSPSSSPDVQDSSTITIQVWLTQGDKLYPTRRTRPHTFTTSRLALTELIAGPSTVEADAGVFNAIAVDTTFEIKGIAAGVATVNFPKSFYAGGRDAARLRQAQVVYTLTQFPTVSRVGFQSAGEPAGWPVGRSDYADLLPRIVVTSPVIGQRISSPVTVSGTADVSESTVSVRILDAAGNEIATRFTTATCGNGCRGDYSMTVPYQLCGERAGVVEVYEVSLEDGSRISVVGIPVVLAACPR